MWSRNSNPYPVGSKWTELNDWNKIKREHPDAFVRTNKTDKETVRLAYFKRGRHNTVLPISFKRNNPPQAGRWSSYHQEIQDIAGEAASGKISKLEAELLILKKIREAKKDGQLTQRDLEVLGDAVQGVVERLREHKNPGPRQYLAAIYELRDRYNTDDISERLKVGSAKARLEYSIMEDDDLSEQEKDQMLDALNIIYRNPHQSFKIIGVGITLIAALMFWKRR